MVIKMKTDFMKLIKRDNQLKAGLIGLLIILIIIIFSPLIANFDPYEFGDFPLAKISEEGHILGTNHLGQDVFSMIVYGTKTSVKVAVVSALISGVIGIIIGGIAGYFGGVVDRVLS